MEHTEEELKSCLISIEQDRWIKQQLRPFTESNFGQFSHTYWQWMGRLVMGFSLGLLAVLLTYLVMVFLLHYKLSP